MYGYGRGTVNVGEPNLGGTGRLKPQMWRGGNKIHPEKLPAPKPIIQPRAKPPAGGRFIGYPGT